MIKNFQQIISRQSESSTQIIDLMTSNQSKVALIQKTSNLTNIQYSHHHHNYDYCRIQYRHHEFHYNNLQTNNSFTLQVTIPTPHPRTPSKFTKYWLSWDIIQQATIWSLSKLRILMLQLFILQSTIWNLSKSLFPML